MRRLSIWALLFILSVPSLHAQLRHVPAARELRGVWIASVANIDWPPHSGLTPAGQRDAFINILDMHKANGINAVFVQVRPAADAFFPSTLEPWSRWLTGRLGTPPSPYYDPLDFMIRESHRRGMEFHAWFNPYRVYVNAGEVATVPPSSLAARHPGWVVRYGKNLYFDPGNDSARDHTVAVVADLVKRYPVDGVHFDDYFYPYKIEGEDFPDSVSFARNSRGISSRDDWRRDNVNRLIRMVGDTIRRIKPHVSFGVSPFGVWRNASVDPLGSATTALQTCYDDLYADVLTWMREGWIDYVAPQLYLPIGHPKVPYETLVKWWCQNSNGVRVYIGQAAYRVNNNADEAWKDPSQLFHQMRLNRTCDAIEGSIFFSSKSFNNNPLGISDSLRSVQYRVPAVAPANGARLGTEKDYALDFTGGRHITIRWKEPEGFDALAASTPYAIYRRPFKNRKGQDFTLVDVLGDQRYRGNAWVTVTDTTARPNRKYVYVVVSFDKFKTESRPSRGYVVKNKRSSWKTYPAEAIR